MDRFDRDFGRALYRIVEREIFKRRTNNTTISELIWRDKAAIFNSTQTMSTKQMYNAGMIYSSSNKYGS